MYWPVPPSIDHQVPTATVFYWPSTIIYQPVPLHTDPVPPSINQYQPILLLLFQTSAQFTPGLSHCNIVKYLPEFQAVDHLRLVLRAKYIRHKKSVFFPLTIEHFLIIPPLNMLKSDRRRWIWTILSILISRIWRLISLLFYVFLFGVPVKEDNNFW